MSRYIDVDEFEKRIKPYDTDDHVDKAMYNFAHNIMLSTSTADVVERKVGKWIKYGDRDCWYCSKCAADNYYAYIRNCDNGQYEQQDKFCPNCGADMKEE